MIIKLVELGMFVITFLLEKDTYAKIKKNNYSN